MNAATACLADRIAKLLGGAHLTLPELSGCIGKGDPTVTEADVRRELFAMRERGLVRRDATNPRACTFTGAVRAVWKWDGGAA